MTDNELFDSFLKAGDSFHHEGNIEFSPGHNVPVILSMDNRDPSQFPAIIEAARNALSRFRENEEEFRMMAFDDVLSLYNSEYRHHSGCEELSFMDFIKQIVLRSMTFHPDGSIECGYGAGDLFEGRMLSLWVANDGTSGQAGLGD